MTTDRRPSLNLPAWLFPNHSFRLLLYLEWILLGLTLLGEIRPEPHRGDGASLPFSLLALIGFGILGLRLPTKKTRNKLLYTGLEFGLLFLTFFIDRRTVFFPLLGLVIVLRSCLMFRQPGRLIVAGLVFIASLLMLFQQLPGPFHGRHGPEPRPPLEHRQPQPGGFANPPPALPDLVREDFATTLLTLRLNAAVTFGLTLLFILLLVNALLAERQSREKLLLANDQLRQYALRIEDQATLQERNRIAREIHDALGHALTAQSIQLENALLFLPPGADKTADFLQQARQLGTRALQDVRRSIATLRSDPLQGQSLEVAITQAIAEFHQTSGIMPEYFIQLSQPLPRDLNTALYRIVQEALTNIYKHSQATQVSLYLHQTQTGIKLRIWDNGQGFDPAGNTTGFGLQGMRERTAALGGQLSLVSQMGQGCQITVFLPLASINL